MFVITRAWSNNPDYDADIDVAVVEITASHAAKLIVRVACLKAMQKEDKAIYQLRYLGIGPQYLSFDAIPQDLYDEVLDREVILREKPEVNESAKANRTDMDELVVGLDGVRWTAVPKHSSIEVETAGRPSAEISLENLKVIANGVDPAAAHPSECAVAS